MSTITYHYFGVITFEANIISVKSSFQKEYDFFKIDVKFELPKLAKFLLKFKLGRFLISACEEKVFVASSIHALSEPLDDVIESTLKLIHLEKTWASRLSNVNKNYYSKLTYDEFEFCKKEGFYEFNRMIQKRKRIIKKDEPKKDAYIDSLDEILNNDDVGRRNFA